MMAMKGLLPPPSRSTTSSVYDHSNEEWFKQRFSNPELDISAVVVVVKAKIIPLYQKRHGFIPRKPEDFGNGGAFPEIHVDQYPLGMCRKGEQQKIGSKILPLTVDAQGNVAFDAIVRQNENASKIVYSSYKDLIPKVLRTGGDDDSSKSEEQLQKEIEEETTSSTKAALEKIVNSKLSAAQPKNIVCSQSNTQFIKYRSSQQSVAFNSGAKERMITVDAMPVDPLEPPKFRHKKVPKASGSPPVPIMHSPTRAVTVKNQQEWKVPPCISNWKNPKGYTIPLDKRLAADGRGLQDVQINDNFAKLAESLYIAEEKARESVEMRSKVQRELVLKEKERKDKDMLALAQNARLERMGSAPPPLSVSMPTFDRIMSDGGEDEDMETLTKESREDREQRLNREKIRGERKRARKRERLLEAKHTAMGKKSKITRDRDRDVSEKVALGMANTGAAGRGGEIMYDTRLFNQEKGMDSGFATDDQYNVYDKSLFTAHNTISTLYKPKKATDSEMYGGEDEQLDKVLKTDRFKPDKGFTGVAERAGPRNRPVEFDESSRDDDDLFGLDEFLKEVRSGKKTLDKVGSGGTMRESGESS